MYSGCGSVDVEADGKLLFVLLSFSLKQVAGLLADRKEVIEDMKI